MTNLENGVVVDGAKLTTPTNYKVSIDASNATPLQVTGGMSATSGAIATVVATTVNTTKVRIGASGDVVNSILTLTSAAANIAAVNVAATTSQIVDLTFTGLLTTDTILKVTPVNSVTNQMVVGNVITAANNASIAIYTAINTNAATAQTFNAVIKR